MSFVFFARGRGGAYYCCEWKVVFIFCWLHDKAAVESVFCLQYSTQVWVTWVQRLPVLPVQSARWGGVIFCIQPQKALESAVLVHHFHPDWRISANINALIAMKDIHVDRMNHNQLRFTSRGSSELHMFRVQRIRCPWDASFVKSSALTVGVAAQFAAGKTMKVWDSSGSLLEVIVVQL